MTFTVVAVDPRTKNLGVGLTSGSLAVPSRCQYVVGGVAAIATQAHTDWRLGEMAMSLVQSGHLSPEDVIRALAETDPHFSYRQLAIVTVDGRIAAHTGPDSLPHASHEIGEDFVVLGNTVSGRHVVDAMYDAYPKTSGVLEERLLQTIEAGYRAGGQVGGQGSGGLVVAMPHQRRPRTDLRVDVAADPHEYRGPNEIDSRDAVPELRRTYEAYRPLIPFYNDHYRKFPDVKRQHWLALSEDERRARLDDAKLPMYS